MLLCQNFSGFRRFARSRIYRSRPKMHARAQKSSSAIICWISPGCHRKRDYGQNLAIFCFFFLAVKKIFFLVPRRNASKPDILSADAILSQWILKSKFHRKYIKIHWQNLHVIWKWLMKFYILWQIAKVATLFLF